MVNNIKGMEIRGDSQEIYTCHICNKDISGLTKKLQQHPTSRIWIRHGQCCAACISPEDITSMLDADITSMHVAADINSEYREAGVLKNRQNGDPHTNIMSGLERAVEIEELKEEKLNRRAKRTVTAGRIIVASSLAGGFLFFYYESFILALICLIICITGIIVYRMGTLKQYRKRSY